MGILGFLIGSLIVVIWRGAWGFEPLWDAEVGYALSAFTAAAGFVWGMGAFSSKMNVHAHEPVFDETGAIVEEAHDEPAEEEADTLTVYGYSMWTVTFWVIILLVVLAVLVFTSDAPVHTTGDPMASSSEVGHETMEIPILGAEAEVSQLTMLTGFIIVTLGTLAVVSAIIGLVVFKLNAGVTEAKATPPSEDALRPPWPVRKFSQGAAWLARVLRGLPGALGNK
jgi:hypothetical protein